MQKFWNDPRNYLQYQIALNLSGESWNDTSGQKSGRTEKTKQIGAFRNYVETRLKTYTMITARGVQTGIDVYKDVLVEYVQRKVVYDWSVQ